MGKYRVYALYTASKFLGEFEGKTKQEAINAAEESEDIWVTLCHQCARKVDIGDVHDFQAEES